MIGKTDRDKGSREKGSQEKERDDGERMTWKETMSVVLACYQAFLPVFLCIAAGLVIAFLLIGLYL